MSNDELPRYETITPVDRLELYKRAAALCGNVTVAQTAAAGECIGVKNQETDWSRHIAVPEGSVAVSITPRSPDGDLGLFWQTVDRLDTL